MNEITKMVIVTTIICTVAATLLAALKEGLKSRIEHQEDFYIRGPAIKSLLQGSPNDPLSDRVTFVTGTESVNIYPWIEEGKVRRIAFERSGHGGYGGDVTVMTAIDLESNNIHGVQVTRHNETPGVGTRVMEPSFLDKLRKISIDNEIKLKKDGGQVDAVTGATRSSYAVTNGADQAAQFVKANKDKIIEQILGNKGS